MVGLTHDLLEVGAGVARMMIELFHGFAPRTCVCFEEFSFIQRR